MEDNRAKFTQRTSLLVIAAVICGFTTPAVAQERKAPPAAEETPDEAPASQAIIVTGTRAVLDSAIDAKRDADAVADFVSIGDVGDLPTTSIADTLEFVPGTVGTRFRGTIDNLSLRGLPGIFTLSTIDGRELSSGDGNRFVRFRIYPDEFFTRAGVYKSTTPNQTEGAISGLIDLSTPSPLKNKPSITASARFQLSPFNKNNDFVDQTGYRFNIEGIRHAEIGSSELGFAFGVNLLDNPVGYARGILPAYSRATLAGQPVILPNAANFLSAGEDFKRTAVNGAVEWSTGKLNVKLNGLYTGAESREDRTFLNFNTLNVPARYSNVVIQGGSLRSGRLTNVPVVLQKNPVSRDDDAFLVGLNIKYETGSWLFEADSYFSQTKVIESVRNVTFASTNLNYDLELRDGGFIDITNISQDLTNTALYAGRNFQGSELSRRDQAKGIRFDATRFFDDGLLNELKVGVRMAERGLEANRLRQDINLANLPQFARGSVPQSLFLRDPGINFDQRRTNGVFPAPFAVFDTPTLLSALPELTYPEDNSELLNQFVDVKERSFTAYLSAEGDFTIGTIPVDFVTGARLVRTNLTSKGFTGVPVANQNPTTGEVIITVANQLDFAEEKNDYTKLLPSLNVRVNWSDALQSRLSVGRAIARANFNDLRLAQTLIGGNADNQPFRGSAGNPQLRPIISDQADLTLEWYPKRGTAFTVNGYYKRVKDFVVTNVREIDVDGFIFQVTSPINTDKGEFYGIEATGRLDFTFLPAPLNDLGALVTFTRNWTTVDPGYGILNEIDAQGVPVFDVRNRDPGVDGFAEKTATAVLFWESGPLTLRGSARYASERVRAAASLNAPRVSRAATTFDLSGSIQLMKQLKLQAQIQNLTNTRDDGYYVFDNYPFWGESYGRTIYVGFDAKF